MFAGLVACLLGVANPALAYRDCCFARSIPPELTGITLFGPIDRSVRRLERAGFRDREDMNHNIAGLGTLVDIGAGGAPREFGGIPAPLVAPGFTWIELACWPSFHFQLGPMGRNPNGARRLETVIAIVDDLDRACAGIEAVKMGSWGVPAFGPAEDDPALGARVREAWFGFQALEVIAPTDPDGVAARWLADGGPRWIGFAVEVRDVNATEDWLRDARVPYVRDMRDGPVLRIDPADLDGLLVVFLQKSNRGGLRF